MVKVREINCKNVLNVSGISGIDYALNPYVGCAHGCIYCYAVFMKRFTGHREPWGSFVDIKINAREILTKQLSKLKPGKISIGTVTDGYQPLERIYQITRSCLDELIKYEFPISILTKSSLILRDIDLLKRMKVLDVGITITTLDEEMRIKLEPNCVSSRERLLTLKKLSEEGIETWIFFGPVLPCFSDSINKIEELWIAFSETKAKRILIDTMNLYPKVYLNLKKYFTESHPELLSELEDIHRNKFKYFEELHWRIDSVSRKFNIPYELCF